MAEQKDTPRAGANGRSNAGWGPSTRMVHAGSRRSPLGETSEALFLTQGFLYQDAEAAEARFKGEDDGFIYSRFGNPTVEMFERRMCALEGTGDRPRDLDARATATGMAAVTLALTAMLRAGDHLVASRALFGSCRWVCETLLPRMGVETTLVDGRDLGAWESAIRHNTRGMFLESPANPALELCDIAGVARLAEQCGATLVVDNVFATPLHQSPLALGAHVVVYSATKHVDGQGRCLGGIVIAGREWIAEHVHEQFRHTGPALSPFNAWVMLKGLETLPLRVRQQTHGATAIADMLAAHGAVTRVLYPGRADHPQHELAKRQMTGGSTMLAFEVAGGKRAAFALANALRIVGISNNLGDARSLITHPATTTHKNLSEDDRAALGISDGMLRLSVGLEDVEDLTADLAAGFEAAREAGLLAA